VIKICTMSLRLSAKYMLRAAPTDVCISDDTLYVSTKSKRVYFIKKGARLVKSIRFSSQVNALGSAAAGIYCACADGRVFGLNAQHKVTFRATADTAGCTALAIDHARREVAVASYGRKVELLLDNGILKNTFYVEDTPVSSVAISEQGVIACASQNKRTVALFNSLTGDRQPITVPVGFPEATTFTGSDRLIIGTAAGAIYVYSVRSRKLIASCIGGAAIHVDHGVSEDIF